MEKRGTGRRTRPHELTEETKPMKNLFVAASVGLFAVSPAPAQNANPSSILPRGPYTVLQVDTKPMMTPAMISLPTAPPKGAVVLLGTDAADLSANFYERRSMNPPKWTMEKGVFSPTNHKGHHQ